MIHVQIWVGSETVQVTDMTNARKRGKKCRVVVVHGGEEAVNMVKKFDLATPYEIIRDAITELASDRKSRGMRMDTYDEEIRGIDAPLPPCDTLTAGIEGVWSASAGNHGISIHNIADRWNEWTEITHGQTKARAYGIAKKVWHLVLKAETCHEAADILSQAGAKLHGFCAID